MTGAHVFHVPQPYRANKDQTVEKPRSRFRWFGHAIGRSNKHLTAVESPRASRRTRSSYLPNDDEFSPSNTPRAKSLTSEADLHKFGLFKHPKSPVDNHSFRSSIASTVSTSTTQSDDLSPRMDNDTTTENDVWIDHAHVVRHYESLNWRLVRIQADGNCLFRAVSDQIYRNEVFYGDIRRRVVEYIEREKELFQPFVENENSGQFEPIDDYCIRMKKDAEWGGNPELYAVARLFNVRIYVHQGPKRRLSIENGCTEAPDMDMHLLFRNDHYDSLHDEAHLDEKPRLSTTLNMDLDDKAPLSVMTENQKEEEPKTEEKKKKKKKSVVFIGEQTRVERVEVELAECVMHKPVRLVVHQGKVCTPEESNQEVDNQEIESEQTHSVPDSEECPATEPQPSPEDEPSTDNQKSDLHVVRAKRVSFRKGRRVAA